MSSSPTRRSPARIASNSNNGASTSNNTPSNSQSATSISNKRALESPGDDGTAAKKACPDDRAIALPFLDMMGTEIVEINVGKGPNQRLFRVYQKRLCDKVPYFQKIFEGGWKESIEKKVTLEDDDPASFDRLLLWVYTGVIPKIEWFDKSGEKLAATRAILNLYVLADKLSLVWLMDKIASEYIDLQAELRFLPGSPHLDLFYTKLSDHMAFRKYAAYCLHYILHGLEQTERNLQIWPATELNQVMADNPTLTLEYLELVQKHPHQERAPEPRTLSRCTFHQHIADEPCTLTGEGDKEVHEEAAEK
ncbi:uncharacterized protein PAC_17064 [Phialocephala subalpina]|uniref:BTB domain-containing protein n=1 Tax=Phialocephala subalpina TaxID=576137 RepID=A0A1L7XQ76_9HELO|nr:uncharacterized protein PAC_17064 [Phialocephala subalpina]